MVEITARCVFTSCGLGQHANCPGSRPFVSLRALLDSVTDTSKHTITWETPAEVDAIRVHFLCSCACHQHATASRGRLLVMPRPALDPVEAAACTPDCD